MTKGTPLTHDQLAQAAVMRWLGHGWRKISREVGGSEELLVRFFEPEKAVQFDTRRLNLDLPHANRARPVPPDHVLAERERVMATELDLTSRLMGDPPKGRSALDRRKNCVTA